MDNFKITSRDADLILQDIYKSLVYTVEQIKYYTKVGDRNNREEMVRSYNSELEKYNYFLNIKNGDN